MIESAIFFLVGFLTAALLALLAAPAITRRARRLAVARARLQAPLSEAQARAERDALRGRHAIEILKLERRVAHAEDERSERKVELGRLASRVATLEDLSAERAAEIERQRGELATSAAERLDLWAQIGSQNLALRDLEARRDDLDSRYTVARARIWELETREDENRVVVAGLETRVASLNMRLSDSWRAATAAEAELARVSAALTDRVDMADRLASELETATTRSLSAEARSAALAAETEELKGGIHQLELRLAGAEAEREGARAENIRALSKLADRETAALAFEEANRDLETRLAELARNSKIRHDDLALENQALATARATMEGALRAARSDRAALQTEIETLRARLAESASAAQTVLKGDQSLRQSIARLGREIARGSSAPEDEAPFVAQVVNFARRETAPEPSPGAVRKDQPMASEG